MPNHIESKIQQACVRWFRLQYPSIARLLFAVPNGGARKGLEAKIMKGEGVTAGVSDLILLVSNGEYSSLCIEMKTPSKTSKQTDHQKQWQNLTEAHGNKYVVCHSVEEFRDAVNDYITN